MRWGWKQLTIYLYSWVLFSFSPYQIQLLGLVLFYEELSLSLSFLFYYIQLLRFFDDSGFFFDDDVCPWKPVRLYPPFFFFFISSYYSPLLPSTALLTFFLAPEANSVLDEKKFPPFKCSFLPGCHSSPLFPSLGFCNVFVCCVRLWIYMMCYLYDI